MSMSMTESVKDDPAFGGDSAPYAVLGYVRESAQRRRGKKKR
jgi:hypothetical protein